MKTVGIIGAGSWGTALGITLCTNGHKVNIWDLDDSLLEVMERSKENKKYLPGVEIPKAMNVVKSMDLAIEGMDIVLFAVPTQHFRSAFEKAIPFLDDNQIIVNVAKGIEQGTLMRLSEIANILKPGLKYVVLSGPSHAEEVGRLMPTTVTVASVNPDWAKDIQALFHNNRFRVYTHEDVVGVELGGALKNIIALGAGISDGMGFGDNAKAAMMTRGIVEMTRLGVALGAKKQTFAGLTGVGDLIVTCTSMHSRNRRCGILIGEGEKTKDAIEKIGMVVEGIYTTNAAYDLAKKVGVEMPITECIYRLTHDEIDAKEAVEILMGRDKKAELK